MTIAGLPPSESVAHLAELTHQVLAWLDTFPGPLQEAPAALRRACWSRGLTVTTATDGQPIDHSARRATRRYAELLLPVDAEGWMAALGPDDASAEAFWQRIDQVEGEGARLAYWFDLQLTDVLSAPPGLELVREVLLRELVSRGCPVDFTIHVPAHGPPVAHVLFVLRDPPRMAQQLYPEAVANRPLPER